VASASDLKETAAAPLAAERLPGESAVKRGADALLRGSVATTSRHIPSLNGIRAGSFLIVFGSHALGGSLIPGGLGVTVFFFLSGYLITTLMRAEYEKNATVSLRHFWLRRALRILPPLYLVVLGSVLLALAVYPPGTVRSPAVASQLLFYANYYDGAGDVPGTRVIWSLAVEEHFYLLFPLFYLATCIRTLRLARRTDSCESAQQILRRAADRPLAGISLRSRCTACVGPSWDPSMGSVNAAGREPQIVLARCHRRCKHSVGRCDGYAHLSPANTAGAARVVGTPVAHALQSSKTGERKTTNRSAA